MEAPRQLIRPMFHQSSDFCGFDRYLVGSWKRTLQWRQFGGSFSHLRTSNTVVVIEEHPSSETSTRCLRWSFGKSLDPEDLLFGFVIRVSTGPGDAELEWQYKGMPCHGHYHHATGLAMLQFNLRTSSVVITYRINDADTMAVCVVEVDEAQRSTIQYGNMYRLDPSLYRGDPSS